MTGALINHHSGSATHVDMCEWSHDSNFTINILLHFLLWMQTKVRFHGPVEHDYLFNSSVIKTSVR